MNTILRVGFWVLVLVLSPGKAQAQEAKTAEDGLFELAKITASDIYIDATGIEAKATAAWPVEPRDDKRNYFNRWTQRHKLSMLKNGEDFLFWAEPDIAKVSDDLLRGEGLTSERVLPDQFDFYLKIKKLLTQKPELKELLSKPVPLQDLPVEVANLVAAVLVAFELGDYPRQSLHARFFEDDFWAQSQITGNLIDPDRKFTRDHEWPFPLQIILQDQQPRLLVEYSPLLFVSRRRNIESIVRAENQTVRTKEGNIARRNLELRNFRENETDLRLTENRKPGQIEVERVIEQRPSQADAKTPWQKIIDAAQIQQALVRLREIPAQADLGEKSRRALLHHVTPGSQLADEAALYKEISLETRRQTLPEFVETLQKLSGVQLSLQGMEGQNVTAQDIERLIISARISNKPMGVVLQNLDRLFGIVWKQQGPGRYVGRVRSRHDWRLRLMQFGDFLLYRSRNALTKEGQAVWQQNINDVVQNTAAYFRASNQKLPAVINFNDLPVAVRKEIRQAAESRARFVLVGAQIRALEDLRGAISVQLAPDSFQFRIYFDGQPGLLIPPARPETILGPFMGQAAGTPARRANDRPPNN